MFNIRASATSREIPPQEDSQYGQARTSQPRQRRILDAYAAAPHGINVNVLCPGWTNTRLVDWNVLGAMMGVSAI
ncbi:MAG: hypothetical protein WAU82_00925 [Candidatus Binatus sp.]|uniref:hypothetical protein n=1 Tax=Candidatus Binatus sp. TaxID=2811406 RepID=UPI003BB0C476